MQRNTAIHQPMYFPYPGILAKAAKSNFFIIYDTAQFSKGYFYNRNRFFMNGNYIWLTIPVIHVNGQELKDVKVVDDRWKKKHLHTIKQYYSKSPFFEEYYEELREIIVDTHTPYLLEIALDSMYWLFQKFNIDVEIRYSSDFPNLQYINNPNDKIIHMLKMTGSDCYIAGPAWRDYTSYEDLSKFDFEGIGFVPLQYNQPYYSSLTEYNEYSTALDMLFALGPKAGEILKGGLC